MENKNLMRDVVEKSIEESQLNKIVEKSLKLATSVNILKKQNHKEDYISYSIAYNEVCERLADMRLIMEQAEFLFNKNEIDTHYNYKLQQLKALTDF
jgi:hypothetical protein